jgi:phosphotransferase system IIB component
LWRRPSGEVYVHLAEERSGDMIVSASACMTQLRYILVDQGRGVSSSFEKESHEKRWQKTATLGAVFGVLSKHVGLAALNSF